MLTFDAFSFYNELDLLELRLNELSDVVDFFVISEATRTHVGNPKRLYYRDNKERFAEFEDKIIHVIVDDMPIAPADIENERGANWLESDYQRSDNWVRERFQRNAIMRGLVDADPDDMIIIGDADEIMRASAVEWAKDNIDKGSIAIGQTMYSYYLNVRSSIPWWGSKVIQKKNITTPSEDRFHTLLPQGYSDGGWHWNFIGNAEAIRLKIRSYAHSEFDTPDILLKVDERLNNLQDVLGRKDLYWPVPIDETFPKYLVDNQDKFSHLIYKVNE